MAKSSQLAGVEHESLSLLKAASLLGCDELNALDNKSLQSVRKLAKTLGCGECELVKTLFGGSK